MGQGVPDSVAGDVLMQLAGAMFSSVIRRTDSDRNLDQFHMNWMRNSANSLLFTSLKMCQNFCHEKRWCPWATVIRSGSDQHN